MTAMPRRRWGELEQLRDSLTHMVAHDMKSPLLAVQLSLDVLRFSLPKDDAETTEILEAARASLNSVVQMIAQMIDVSRMESGHLQLERTRATFQWGRLPSWTDVVHFRHYAIYRITGKNVGPWGLSAIVDTRPMVLRPAHTRVGAGAPGGLAGLHRHRSGSADAADAAARWSDVLTPDVPDIGPVGDLYRPVDPPQPSQLLPDAPFKEDMGSGLFASLNLVRWRPPISPEVGRILDDGGPSGRALPPLIGTTGQVGHVALRVRGREIAVRTLLRDSHSRQAFIGIEEDHE